jgi:hypothetical protein
MTDGTHDEPTQEQAPDQVQLMFTTQEMDELELIVSKSGRLNLVRAAILRKLRLAMYGERG